MGLKIYLIVFASICLFSCASIKSVEAPITKTADGLSYFMPRKDIVISVTVDKSSNVSSVAITTTPAYPDTSIRYVLTHGGNVFGKNTLDVGITENGLLTSTKSTTVSSVSDTFTNLATSIGAIESFGIVGAEIPVVQECIQAGVHTFVFDVKSEGGSACDLEIIISKLGSAGGMLEHTQTQGASMSGIFYRQNEPYQVVVRGAGIVASSIAFSPSDSNTYFLPVSKTFFSNNDADFELKDGIPTKYKQVTDSEVVSLFKLPADVIGAYFSAIGKVFDSFKASDSSEVTALSGSLKLELEKRKYVACLDAIQADDEEKIKSLGC